MKALLILLIVISVCADDYKNNDQITISGENNTVYKIINNYVIDTMYVIDTIIIYPAHTNQEQRTPRQLGYVTDW
jgi:hypothetical protein